MSIHRFLFERKSRSRNEPKTKSCGTCEKNKPCLYPLHVYAAARTRNRSIRPRSRIFFASSPFPLRRLNSMQQLSSHPRTMSISNFQTCFSQAGESAQRQRCPAIAEVELRCIACFLSMRATVGVWCQRHKTLLSASANAIAECTCISSDRQATCASGRTKTAPEEHPCQQGREKHLQNRKTQRRTPQIISP